MSSLATGTGWPTVVSNVLAAIAIGIALGGLVLFLLGAANA